MHPYQTPMKKCRARNAALVKSACKGLDVKHREEKGTVDIARFLESMTDQRRSGARWREQPPIEKTAAPFPTFSATQHDPHCSGNGASPPASISPDSWRPLPHRFAVACLAAVIPEERARHGWAFKAVIRAPQ
eukprot:CAMPEP_0114114974 /NCGR_PEP_ID=MMETSP0043_2-20121206/3723_1 /TAXON_ID=464988 /ORGANISM="Hemiselmis andersenii, Strain CCMP644" /LENGTH=132 /DNA_ID=CAMNT_0001207209 /DNA_START=171 /DNA_END=570 /DNA_ORIENTATION=+